MSKTPELHINIDHIATLRNARRTIEPSPLEALKLLQGTQVSGVTLHLREDRRHINDQDMLDIDAFLQNQSKLSLTFEMGASEEIRKICLQTQAKLATIVPEKREELTTEGGLDVANQKNFLKDFIKPIQKNNTQISFFVDPVPEQIIASHSIGAEFIEIHTGTYANLFIQYHSEHAGYGALSPHQKNLKFEDLTKPVQEEITRISAAVELAQSLKLQVNLGHGLTIPNLGALLSQTPNIQELHIGHSIISNSIYFGLTKTINDFMLIISQKDSNQ